MKKFRKFGIATAVVIVAMVFAIDGQWAVGQTGTGGTGPVATPTPEPAPAVTSEEIVRLENRVIALRSDVASMNRDLSSLHTFVTNALSAAPDWDAWAADWEVWFAEQSAKQDGFNDLINTAIEVQRWVIEHEAPPLPGQVVSDAPIIEVCNGCTVTP